jgi:hypothetical protein
MARIQASVTGIAAHPAVLKDSSGVGTIPIQVYIPAGVTATYRVVGRVSPEAPWVEIRGSLTTGLLEAMQYCPYIALDITAIAGGSIVLWTGDH